MVHDYPLRLELWAIVTDDVVGSRLGWAQASVRGRVSEAVDSTIHN